MKVSGRRESIQCIPTDKSKLKTRHFLESPKKITYKYLEGVIDPLLSDSRFVLCLFSKRILDTGGPASEPHMVEDSTGLPLDRTNRVRGRERGCLAGEQLQD